MSLRSTSTNVYRRSSCHCRFAHRKVAVRLTYDSPLGAASDVVEVTAGTMRHSLFPTGQAVYVPWKRRSQITSLLEETRNRQVEARLALEAPPTPVAPTETLPSIPKPYLPSQPPSATLSLLSTLPATISISARIIPSSSSLFGSVSLADVTEIIAATGAKEEDVLVSWSEPEAVGLVGGRVKELGTYAVEIGLRGDEEERVVGRLVEVVAAVDAEEMTAAPSTTTTEDGA